MSVCVCGGGGGCGGGGVGGVVDVGGGGVRAHTRVSVHLNLCRRNI